jgi:hypothetical protein
MLCMLAMKSNLELVSETRSLVKEERRIILQVLKNLREIEERRFHLELGYSSLEEMCIKEFSYSNGAAYRRCQSMRLMREVPHMEKKIKEGVLNLTTLSLAFTHFHQVDTPLSEKKEILRSLECKSTRETIQILDSLNPKKKKTYTLEIDEETYFELQRLKDTRSHEKKTECELLLDLIKTYLKKRETSRLSPAQESRSGKRYLPQRIQKEVRKRGQCEFTSQAGRRCSATSYLQIHHEKAFAKGGSNDIGNLKLFCRAHNIHEAIKEYGDEKMAKYLKL